MEVICTYCQTPFEMPNKEYNRHQKRGWVNKFCCAEHRYQWNRENPLKTINSKLIEVWGTSVAADGGRKGNLERQKRLPQFNFVETLRRCRQNIKRFHNSNRILDFDLDQKSLLEIWQRQNGKCPYTGWDLEIPKQGGYGKQPNSASLDRIDSGKGYTKDNVQFVSVMINLAKSNFQEKDLHDFCDAIKGNWNKNNL